MLEMTESNIKVHRRFKSELQFTTDMMREDQRCSIDAFFFISSLVFYPCVT